MAELVAAIGRIDGQPGSSASSRDLVQVMLQYEPSALQAALEDLLRLARTASNDAVREGAWAGLIRADGAPDAVWAQATSSPRGPLDIVNAVGLVQDAAHRAALYPRLVALLEAPPSKPAGTPATATVPGRFIRITAPGRDRTLTLAEVEVTSGGTNIAPRGTATQSSTVSSGAVGGHAPNAIDGKLTSVQEGSNVPTGVTFTSQEADPWWELDLGREMPIERIEVRLPDGAQGGRDAVLHVSVLSAARASVFARDGLSLRQQTHALDVGGDDAQGTRRAAMLALTQVPGRASDTVALLARLFSDGASGSDALAALRAVPLASWPSANVGPVAERVVAYARDLPAAARTGTAFREAVTFGRTLSSTLPSAERARIEADLDALTVRQITLTAVAAQMRFDLAQFTVYAGEDIELVFVNADEMPHNVLITAQGALETVSLKAEAMAATPDGFAKQFVPDTPLVLAATKLIGPGETARLRFTAPKETGGYPFVCTFPGHWRTMNGTMNVIREAPGTESR